MPWTRQVMRGSLMSDAEYTDFGYEQVTPGEKRRRVGELFDSVATRYDLMNDLMSLGIHRFWKRYAVHIAGIRAGDHILDVAGGTGDMARLFCDRVGTAGSVTICDISHEMVCMGRDRLTDSGNAGNIRFVQGDAENLPFIDNSFDFICIAFGLRNVTDKQRALESMYAKLKYGSSIFILEFSRVLIPSLGRIYDKYSDVCIPAMGRYFANDEASYRYLVESIRMHPDQETLKSMLEAAGFSRVHYYNLSGGIVAIHKACKI